MQLILLLICLTYSVNVIGDAPDFEAVRQMVFSDPAAELPHYEVSKEKFGPSEDGASNQLLKDAQRTLENSADFVTFGHEQKLFQPNGICFSGRWHIDKASKFTGLFSHGTDVPAIVRISVMLSGTTRADKRAVGMAIKLFAPGQAQTANILVMESMGGRHLQHISDAVLDNHPTLGSIPGIADLKLLLRIRKDLNRALTHTGSSGVKIRYLPLQHVAATNIEQGRELLAPYWIRLHVAAGTPKIDADDFREELTLHHYPNGVLSYVISVAPDNGGSKRKADWKEIGKLELTDSVISKACDTRLHFKHHGLTIPLVYPMH
ncbi:MAG: hypothetical protein ACU84Q_06755 [Gammaproteobacteria bacterium]